VSAPSFFFSSAALLKLETVGELLLDSSQFQAFLSHQIFALFFVRLDDA